VAAGWPPAADYRPDAPAAITASYAGSAGCVSVNLGRAGDALGGDANRVKVLAGMKTSPARGHKRRPHRLDGLNVSPGGGQGDDT